MSTMTAIPGYMTCAEAADEIGVSHSQVTRYIKQGLLPSVPAGDRLLLIPEQAVKQFERPPRGTPSHRKMKK